MSAALDIEQGTESTEQERFALSEAVRLAEHGYALTPVRLTRNTEDGKKVARFFLNWRRSSAWSNDPAQIRDWWATYGPCSFAHGCAANGTEGVDLDANRPAWWAEQGHPTGALVHRTPSGSVHHIWAADPDGEQLPQEAGATLGRGVDARNGSGLFYAPGSYIEGESGSYRVEGELPRREALARTPASVLALFADRAERSDRPADGRITFHDREWLRARYAEALERVRSHDVDTGGYRDKLLGAGMVLGRLVDAELVDRERAVADLTAAHLSVWGASRLYSANRRDIDRSLADGPSKERWREDPGPQELTPDPGREAGPDYWARWEAQFGAQASAHGTNGGTGGRVVRLKRASEFVMRATDWLWDRRIPSGSLTLVAGREGDGKSTLMYTVLAQVTRGTLAGDLHGTPRNVAVAATEDSWEMTIVPRLAAAGADLDRVFHIEVMTSFGAETVLQLPHDLAATETVLREAEVPLLLLDPLMSRLEGRLDTHKDGEVRQALEPLVALADRARCATVGLIHLNKAGGADPLNAIMASKAFVAVARSVLFVLRDPDDEQRRQRSVGLAKSNLTDDSDVPTLNFTIESRTVGEDPESGKPIMAGALAWGAESSRSIRDMITSASEDPDDRSAVDEAKDWLDDYLTQAGGGAPRKTVIGAGRVAGHSESALKRAARTLRIEKTSGGFPRESRWSLPGASTVGSTDVSTVGSAP
ncbi:AAA family ATPase [Pseudonocardia sp. MH-G8]|uniref:AAA family ATPase n=1 Tax=Pseudonocardia sp. MH-G8 TaxID=1854588 RepID=UPI0013044CA9|nr:AAA family ATPase [Pseudonocardia sp. MH-G8]